MYAQRCELVVLIFNLMEDSPDQIYANTIHDILGIFTEMLIFAGFLEICLVFDRQ